MTERLVEVPHPLKDVADPCTEEYYPRWSSRGMRAVRCTRPAKGTVLGQRKCGVHLKRYSEADRD